MTPKNKIQQIDERKQEIRRTLGVFHRPGDVVEIRAIGVTGATKPHVEAGYFSNFDEAAFRAAEIDVLKPPEGIYFVLNTLNPALLARAANKTVSYLKSTTSDGDILRRRWLLIDIDPKRPSGISSTDEELEAACMMAERVKAYLSEEQHWPVPVEALSGNGRHLLYPFDMRNDPESCSVIKAVLAGLNAKFNVGDSKVSIDTSVFNAARITKLYGTMARKGSDIPGRPHRQSKLLCVPDYLEPHHEKDVQCQIQTN